MWEKRESLGRKVNESEQDEQEVSDESANDVPPTLVPFIPLPPQISVSPFSLVFLPFVPLFAILTATVTFLSVSHLLFVHSTSLS